MDKEVKHFVDVDEVKQIMAQKSVDEQMISTAMQVKPMTVKRMLSKAKKNSVSFTVVFRFAKALGVGAAAILKK